jgi:hypothetical protein
MMSYPQGWPALLSHEPDLPDLHLMFNLLYLIYEFVNQTYYPSSICPFCGGANTQ